MKGRNNHPDDETAIYMILALVFIAGLIVGGMMGAILTALI